MKVKQIFFAFSLFFMLVCLSFLGEEEVKAAPSLAGVQLSDEEDSSGEGWSYSAADHVLTLTDYQLTEGDIAISAPEEDLTILLVGENVISVSSGIGIRCENLEFTGEGSLNVTCTSGIAISVSGLKISGGDITAIGSGTGVYCKELFEISGGSLNAEATDDIAGQAVYAYNMNVNGGSVTAVSAGANASAINVSFDLTVNGGEINATAADIADNNDSSSRGIGVGGTFTVLDGTVTASGGGGMQGGNAVIKGGTVNLTGATYNGLDFSSVNITAGNLTVAAKNYGILARSTTLGTIDISGGTIDISVTSENGFGIYALDSINISGGTVSISVPEKGWHVSADSVVIDSDNAAVTLIGGYINQNNSEDSEGSIDPGTPNESDTVESTGSTAGSDSADSASVSAESTYLSDSGVEMRRIAAQGNGATAIDGAAEYIPTGTKFTCVELTSGEIYDLAAEIVSTNISKADGFWVFNMNLTDVSNAAIHQLNGFINVMLPIPEGLNIADGKKLVVYRIEDDGTLTKCDTITDNGYILFATDHFSTYVVVEETAVTSPKTGDDNVIFVWIAIALAAGIGSIFFWKKFRLQNRMV